MWSLLLYAGHKQFYLCMALRLLVVFCGTFHQLVSLKRLTVLHTVEGSDFQVIYPKVIPLVITLQ